MVKDFFRSLVVSGVLFAALPSSSHYSLGNYGFGSGGTSNSGSSNYKLSGISGDEATGKSSSTNYKSGNGLTFTEQANVPLAPVIQNLNSNYDKLHYAINQPTSNASDYLYSIAISSDGFVTTRYVQPDHTVSPTFAYGDNPVTTPFSNVATPKK